MDNALTQQYVGFWARAALAIIDWLVITALTIAIIVLFFLAGGRSWLPSIETSQDFRNTIIVGGIFYYLLIPYGLLLLMWISFGTSLAKMPFRVKIVDIRSGQRPPIVKLVLRMVGYLLCCLSGGLGFIWVAFDPKKQGLHDRLAGTFVVRAN